MQQAGSNKQASKQTQARQSRRVSALPRASSGDLSAELLLLMQCRAVQLGPKVKLT